MIYEQRFTAMGCHIFAALDGDSPRAARQLEKLPAWFEEWENILSRFRPESELNRLNRSAGQAFPTSSTLWAVLQAADQAYQSSSGLVTPAVLDALEAAGYDRSFELLGSSSEARPVQGGQDARVSFAAAEMDARSRTVRLPAGLRLDLGGVAKGWAAQAAVKRLQAYGPALVNAGGDIAVSGLQTAGRPWEIGITDPRRPEGTLVALTLGHGGVATSGRDYRRWLKDGVWQHHLIDPRTNRPSTGDLLAATIIASGVQEAETAAKVVMILGSAAGAAWLETRPGLAGYLIYENGQTKPTANFEKYLRR